MQKSSIRDVVAGHDVLRAFVGLLVLVGVTFGVQAQPLQVPGYLVFLGFDILQNQYLPGVGETTFWSLFVGYCYLLAVVVAKLHSLVRRVRGPQSPTSPPPR